MLNVILADTELEPVPRELLQHPSVRAMAERREKPAKSLLLDSNFHHSAMRGLNDAERRGRPDLLHYFLLTALDSPLNRDGQLRLFVHCRHDKILRVNPATQLPQSYNRFLGLMEQLFEKGRVGDSENTFFELGDGTVSDILKEIEPDFVCLLSENGEKKQPKDIGKELAKHKQPVVIVGGFTHGDFRTDVGPMATKTYCIDPDLMKAWTVSTRMIYVYEDAIDLAKKRMALSSDPLKSVHGNYHEKNLH